MNSLPAPSAAALETSTRLVTCIREDMVVAGGSIPFSRFMELCLYTPGLGYYSADQQKFGPGGDFVTAPEISPLFGRCLANTCRCVLQSLGGGDILEFGAGSGQLAIDLLGELDASGCLPGHYYILERSAVLKERQQAAIHDRLPHLRTRVSWLESLPGPGFRGVMLANEVLDAMAVERFRWDADRATLLHVQAEDNGFSWQPADSRRNEVTAAIDAYVKDCKLAPGYISEFNSGLQPWLHSVADCLDQGLILLIDYGYPLREYFHPQRNDGTLMCHYRQHAHADPFVWPGLQDITAHVDFTAVAEAAVAVELEVTGYTTQAYFLLDCDLDELLQQVGPVDTIDYLRAAQQVKTLLLPGEMGERFKCMGLTRGIESPLPGFRQQDFRHRL